MAHAAEFDLLIFDCDGVLVDSEPLVNQIYADMLAELGYAVDYEESLHEFAGAAMSTRLRVLSQRLGWSPSPDFANQFTARQTAVFAEKLRPVAGINKVITGLSTPFCVASNGNREEIVFRLQTCGLLHHFQNAIFSGTETPRPKPYPDVFLAAANAFNVEPQRCVVIEDSVTGVTAAIRAGMRVFGHAVHTSAAHLSDAGATPFASMSELAALLQRPAGTRSS
ncbi:MAG TPA: HAD family phosphatase [Rhodocyclaceae bacterium]|nr:HAD family phosphatase [Rhodocyclaceae bacterium]